MMATVVKGAYVALPVAQDDDRIIADLHREEAAGPGRFAIMAGEQPFAITDQFHIEPEEIGIGAKALVQGIAVLRLSIRCRICSRASIRKPPAPRARIGRGGLRRNDARSGPKSPKPCCLAS